MQESWKRFEPNVVEFEATYRWLLQARREAAQLATTTRDPAWIVFGREIQAVQERFDADLLALSIKTAEVADKAIVSTLRSREFRPPTGERPGIKDVIESAPTVQGAFSMSEVEIAHIAKLDTAVGPGGAAYWQTQEFGSSHNVGRVIFGSFVGGPAGDSVPSQLMFRRHPVFQPGPGGFGTINRPILAKHFLRDGTAIAETFWLAGLKECVLRLVAGLKAISIP